MALLPILNAKKEQVGELKLADELLKDRANKTVVYNAVKRHLASKHHGTVDTKTRAEVNRTGKKSIRQKGSGGARHGSRKTAPFVGGGRVFGPHQRDYTLGMPKKVRQLAIREVLRTQIMEGKVTLLDAFPMKAIKTKDAVQLFGKLGIEAGLVVIEGASEIVQKSIRNIKNFKVLRADQINVFDLLKYPRVVFTSKAFSLMQDKYLS